MIEEDLWRKLGLSAHDIEVPLCGLGGSRRIAHKATTLRVVLQRPGQTILELPALILQDLGISTPCLNPDQQHWPHLRGLRLADPVSCPPRKVEILLGVRHLSSDHTARSSARSSRHTNWSTDGPWLDNFWKDEGKFDSAQTVIIRCSYCRDRSSRHTVETILGARRDP